MITGGEFRVAVESTHGAKASHAGQEQVEERFEGEMVWEGEVHSFTLEDHPTADRAYAFVMDGEIVCVLHEMRSGDSLTPDGNQG